MNPLILVVAIVGGIAGIASTAYLLFSLPAVILWKLYRRVRFSIPVMK